MDRPQYPLNGLTERAMQIHVLYDKLNDATRGHTWTREEFMLGFVGDVGDLAKLVMAKEGARPHPAPSTDAALAHELADCLWSVLVLAHLYNIDLDRAFEGAMSQLETSIEADLRKAEAPAQ